MRNRLYIPQGEINAAGLIGQVNIECWILLDYIRHWPSCKNIRRQQWDGLDFFWLDYETACSELPLLFPNDPKLATKINKLTLLVRRLRSAGLIDTRRLGPRCYMRITSRAAQLYERRESHRPCIDTPIQDVQTLESRDIAVMESRESAGPVHIYKEQLDKETAVHKPASHDINELSESIAKIFGRTYLEPHELRELRRQLPIPAGEITLVSRFYELPPNFQDFMLSRRRKSPSTLLHHWTEVVDQAAYYFKASRYKWNQEWGPIPQVRFLAS